MEKITISIVIACHNQVETTQKCFDKLRNMRTDSFDTEFVLVDNASTDQTRSWAGKQKDIRYIRNQINLGCAIARNQGAKWASGDFLFFLDNDQFVAENTLEDMFALRKKAHLIGVELWDVIDKKGITSQRHDGLVTNKSYVGAGGLLIRKIVFSALGGFDERYAPMWYEDVDFSYRARAAGYKLLKCDTANVVHLANTTSSSQKDYDVLAIKQKSRKLFVSTWKKQINARPVYVSRKPKIVVCFDVAGWAWHNKAQQIYRHLKDEFDIILWNIGISGFPTSKEGELVFYFEQFGRYQEVLKGSPYINGVTAHTYKNHPAWIKYLQSAKAIHANSVLLTKEIQTINKNGCYYLPNGVDPERFPFIKRDKSKDFTVGYVGKETPAKGLKSIIEPACEKAGVRLKALVGRYNSPTFIHNAEMKNFYASVDVVLIASTMDGTPNMLLEAASVGRTFIGNSIGNVPEFVEEGENGFLVELNVDKYVEKIEFLKQDRKKCIEMGKKARETVEAAWTWKIQSERYRDMFRKCL